MPIVLKSGSLNLLEPSGPVNGLLYLYLYFIYIGTLFYTLILKHERVFTSFCLYIQTNLFARLSKKLTEK
jgi:hypothetical protein